MVQPVNRPGLINPVTALVRWTLLLSRVAGETPSCREGKPPAQGCTAFRRQSRDPNPGLVPPKPGLFPGTSTPISGQAWLPSSQSLRSRSCGEVRGGGRAIP